MTVKVYVTLKKAVLDPQGKAVEQALQRLGFAEVNGVRVGKFIELEVNETDAKRAKARAKEMCERLLANLVIEDYRFDVAG